jgi:hypothetical protein
MLVCYLQWLSGTLLFFWPVVAWVNRRIDTAREHACDEWALRHGRLTAGEYARCLLKAAVVRQSRRLTYCPAYMAGNPKTIERRIDMILKSTGRRARRRLWGLLAIALVAVWGAFALTGAAQAGKPAPAEDDAPAPTKADVEQHTLQLIQRISSYAAADVDGSGETSRPERTAYVVTVVLGFPDEVLEAYPEADINGDGQMELEEAFHLVRGNIHKKLEWKQIERAKQEAEEAGADKARIKVIKAEAKDAELRAASRTLDMLEWLLDEMPTEPNLEQVTAVMDQLAPIEAERANAEKEKKIAGVRHEIGMLKKKAEEMRAAAHEYTGKTAEKLESKAAKLDEKRAQLEAKLAELENAEAKAQ